MHFENVQLPSAVIAGLYKETLVMLQDVQPTDTKKVGVLPAKEVLNPAKAPLVNIPLENEVNLSTPATALATSVSVIVNGVENPPFSFKYLGGFTKQIAIVVADHFNPHIGDDDLAFLTKLLAACNLSLSDVAIINVVNNPQASQLWQLMPAKALLMFGVDPGSLGLAFRRPHFEVQEWAGSMFLTAPDIEKFRIGAEQDIKLLKTKLWLSLQKIFLGK